MQTWLLKIAFQANGSNQTVSAWNKHCSTWFEPSFDDRTLHKPFICPLLSFPLKMTSPTSTNQKTYFVLVSISSQHVPDPNHWPCGGERLFSRLLLRKVCAQRTSSTPDIHNFLQPNPDKENFIQAKHREFHPTQTSKISIPRTSSENLISYWWLKEIYSQLPYHYRKNLKGQRISCWKQWCLVTRVHSDVWNKLCEVMLRCMKLRKVVLLKLHWAEWKWETS